MLSDELTYNLIDNRVIEGLDDAPHKFLDRRNGSDQVMDIRIREDRLSMVNDFFKAGNFVAKFSKYYLTCGA